MILLVSGATQYLRSLPDTTAIGHLITPAAGNNVDVLAATGLPIGADNGCYHELDERAFVRMLNRLRTIRSYHRRRPLWVAVPDKVGDHAETMALWRWYHHYVRGSDLPMAFVAQNGAEEGPIPWGKIDCLFIGGTSAWKTGPAAAALIRKAHALGKWVHVGRVNTLTRYWRLSALPVDSIDGSGFSRYNDRIPWMVRRFAGIQHTMQFE